MAITHYMYVMTNPPTIDRKIRLHYTKSETVDHVSQLEHELAREALRYHGIEDKMEISSMADLPSGTGLGSSSCYLVGLLMALNNYRRNFVPLQKLAEQACDIELRILQKGVGKQDQYMAAYGGLTRLDIEKDGAVKVRAVETSISGLSELVANTHLYYTGLCRDATEMLADQDKAMKASAPLMRGMVEDSLSKIKDLGYQLYDAIVEEDFDKWGYLTHEHWLMKRQLSSKVSITKVDQLYEEVRTNHHVLGGKVVGAGGGGFLLLYCNKNHRQLERFMATQGMPRLHYSVEPEGCKVMGSFTSHQAFDAEFGPKGELV
jgi:D-glycero-alpha-D-manno-heptose-7-phosphate kinase